MRSFLSDFFSWYWWCCQNSSLVCLIAIQNHFAQPFRMNTHVCKYACVSESSVYLNSSGARTNCKTDLRHRQHETYSYILAHGRSELVLRLHTVSFSLNSLSRRKWMWQSRQCNRSWVCVNTNAFLSFHFFFFTFQPFPTHMLTRTYTRANKKPTQKAKVIFIIYSYGFNHSSVCFSTTCCATPFSVQLDWTC